MSYETFKVNIENHIAHVIFSRPHKANALNKRAWEEMKVIFEDLNRNADVRVILLSGAGKHFCAGIDLEMLMNVGDFASKGCESRKRERFINTLKYLQSCVNAIEQCRKPVLAAIHKACVGGGVDIISACDMRYCTEDTYFCVKEIDMGLVADLGTMQRLPKIIPYGIAAEMAYTGRNVYGKEAKNIGLSNQVYIDKETMITEVTKIAESIAAKSPITIRGTKHILKYSRDHSVMEGLSYMQAWNAAMIFSDDLMEAFQATVQKRKPEFKG